MVIKLSLTALITITISLTQKYFEPLIICSRLNNLTNYSKFLNNNRQLQTKSSKLMYEKIMELNESLNKNMVVVRSHNSHRNLKELTNRKKKIIIILPFNLKYKFINLPETNICNYVHHPTLLYLAFTTDYHCTVDFAYVLTQQGSKKPIL